MKKQERKNYKYNIKQFIILFFLFFNSLFLVSVFGRYVVNKANDFFARSKVFYFYSDKLDVNNPVYQIENWSGVDDYVVIINMNSYKNILLTTAYDVEYDISYTASDNVICQLTKTSGVIKGDSHTDSFNLIITPNQILETGDVVAIEITAKATAPYEQELKGRFNLIVGQEQLTYEVEDSAYNPYLEVNITNTLSYYIVQEDFGEYEANDRIVRDVYLSLSEEDKAKCYSKIVTINFDTNSVMLDMTSNAYVNAVSTTTTTRDNHTYINSVTFKIDALSSQSVRFYKIDESQDYTNNNSNIINVTSV